MHQRSSVRSHGSSSSHSSPRSRREKCKDCCRNTIAFMCTQVGVGGLIVGYALVGAVSFISIETNANYTNNNYIDEVLELRNKCASQLWQVAHKQNVFNETELKLSMNSIIKKYQDNMTDAIRKGYDGRTPKEVWSFPAALMFCLSVFSMIGYGNMVPRTRWGKGLTFAYATFGIPLYILYFMNIGRVLAKTFRWLYTWFHECSSDRNSLDDSGSVHTRKRVIVPATACLWVMVFYIIIGTLMFAHWERWSYLDAVYFCVTSLCKIGFGDFVPGTSTNGTISVLGLKIQDSQSEKHTKLIINFVYMLFGMGLVAMCYNLMREGIKEKIKEMTEDMALCLEDLRQRFARCCGNKEEFDYEYD